MIPLTVTLYALSDTLLNSGCLISFIISLLYRKGNTI